MEYSVRRSFGVTMKYISAVEAQKMLEQMLDADPDLKREVNAVLASAVILHRKRIAENVKRIRTQKGFTPAALAVKAQATTLDVIAIEQGGVYNLRVLLDIARALEIDADLLCKKWKPFTPETR